MSWWCQGYTKNTSVNLWSTLVGLSFTNIWKCTSIISVKSQKKIRVEKKLFCKHNFLMWRCAKELSDVTTRTRRKSLFYFGLPLISAFIYVSVHGWPILVILWQRGWETVEKSLPAIDIKKKSGKIMFYSCQTDDCSAVTSKY